MTPLAAANVEALVIFGTLSGQVGLSLGFLSGFLPGSTPLGGR